MRAAQLAKAECCNYLSTGPYGLPHYCLLYRRCRVVTAAKTPCAWFAEAVAPQDDQAQAEYRAVISGEAPPMGRAQRRAVCETCGEVFGARANSAKYCSDSCRRVARKEQYRASKQRQRARASTRACEVPAGSHPQLEVPQTRIPSGVRSHEKER